CSGRRTRRFRAAQTQKRRVRRPEHREILRAGLLSGGEHEPARCLGQKVERKCLPLPPPPVDQAETSPRARLLSEAHQGPPLGVAAAELIRLLDHVPPMVTRVMVTPFTIGMRQRRAQRLIKMATRVSPP